MNPVLDQALTFSGNASDANCTAYFPKSLRGQTIEMTIYVEFSSTAAAGKVQVQTAKNNEYTGTWANLGSTIDFAAASSQKYASVTGVFDRLRLDIDTAITTGTVRAWVVAASHAA